MKYKIKNHIIDAKSPVEALKIHKMLDSLKDSYYIVACEKGDYWFDETGKPNSFNKARKFNSYEEADRWRRSKGEGSVQKITDEMKDSDDIDYLTEEEYQAVEDYRKAIANTTDPKLLKLFAHILKEETEHIEELQSEEVEDSVKDSKYVIYRKHDNYYLGNGARSWVKKGSNNIDIYNSKEEALKDLKEYVDDYDAEVIELKDSVEDSCKTKDYQPPYAIWVKESGKWKIWGGTHSTNVDKNAFKAKGYEDVVVVKNGEEPR